MLYAFDFETYLIQPGLLTPRVVCGSWASEDGTHLALRDEALDKLEELLREHTIIGANTPYDLGVLAAERPWLVPLIFEAVDKGSVLDTHILEPLHDNARGLMFQEANGAPFNRYSLQLLENRYLGIDRAEQKHGENAWRLRYGELDGVPLEHWPEEAKQYPLADAYNTLRIGEIQTDPLGDRANLQCVTQEMRAAWALHLACVWGMRTDVEMVPRVVEFVAHRHEESRRKFFEAGIVRVRKCTKKAGVYEDSDPITRELLLIMLDQLESTDAPWVEGRKEDVRTCLAAIDRGVPLRYAEDKKQLAALVTAAYQGDPPRTEKGAVSTSRDTLSESGDEVLEAYAEVGANEKLHSTYSDLLMQGTKAPINPSANTLVATQRVSMRKPNLQQLPRGSDSENAAFFEFVRGVK